MIFKAKMYTYCIFLKDMLIALNKEYSKKVDKSHKIILVLKQGPTHPKKC